MKTALVMFVLAAMSGGMAHWAHLIGQTNGNGGGLLWETIQLGGTGGLILALLAAVWFLWKDRAALVDLLTKERATHLGTITAERKDHRAEVAEIRAATREEVTEATERLMKVMTDRINDLRNHQDQGS